MKDAPPGDETQMAKDSNRPPRGPRDGSPAQQRARLLKALRRVAVLATDDPSCLSIFIALETALAEASAAAEAQDRARRLVEDDGIEGPDW